MSEKAAGPGDDAIHFDESFLLEVGDMGERHAALIGILDDLYRVRATSFVRYLVDWKPYTNAKTLPLRNVVNALAQANEAGIVELIDLLEAFGATPRSAMFNMQTAHSNYTDWKNLLPRLYTSQKKTVACIANALVIIVGCSAEDQVRPALQAQLADDESALATLEEWTTALAD